MYFGSKCINKDKSKTFFIPEGHITDKLFIERYVKVEKKWLNQLKKTTKKTLKKPI